MSGTVTEWHYYAIQLPFSYLSGTFQFTEWHMYSFILCLHETFSIYSDQLPTFKVIWSCMLPRMNWCCYKNASAMESSFLSTQTGLAVWQPNYLPSSLWLIFFCDGVKLSKLVKALFLKTLQDVLSFSLKRYRMSWVYPNEGTCLSSGLASLGYGCGLNQLISPTLWRRSSQSHRSRSAFELHNLWRKWTAPGIRK